MYVEVVFGIQGEKKGLKTSSLLFLHSLSISI